MDLLERTIYLSIGGGIGFILGYIVARLRVIEKKVDYVQREVHEVYEHEIDTPIPVRDERGVISKPTIKALALFLVVILTAWASFASQKASNDANSSQEAVVGIVVCNQDFLQKTISALNERTTYTIDAAKANVNVQKSQAAFFTLLLGYPPKSEEIRRNAAQAYLDDLTKFVKISEKNRSKLAGNPYPTPEAFTKCLDQQKSLKEPK